jgi:hypothetical protein
MNKILIKENSESWVITIDDLIVTQCRIDHAFGIEFWESEESYLSLRIEGIFNLMFGNEKFDLYAGKEPIMICPALGVLHKNIESITIQKTGILELIFTNEMRITVFPSPDYEAWTISGSNGLLFVCQPGGKIAVWNPK